MVEHRPTNQSKVLLEALKKAGIRFAHWKGNSHLMKALEGQSDIELLIDPAHKEDFEEVMKKLSFKKATSPKWSTYPKVEDWIGFDSETGNLLHLHTHYTIVTGIKYVKHLYLPWLEEFFSQLKTDPKSGWPIPKPELEAIVLLIRIWAKMPLNKRMKKNPEVPENSVQELVQLLKDSSTGTLVKTCKQLKLKIPESFILSIEKIKSKDDNAEIIKLAKFFYRQVKQYYRKPWISSLAQYYYFKNYLKFTSFFFRFFAPLSYRKKLNTGGKIFALIGSDGSGKSTLSNDLVNWLTYKIDTHYFYLGKAPFIRSYNKVIFSPTHFLQSENGLSKKLRKALGSVYHLLLPQKKLKMLHVAKGLSQSGSLVICDRFPQMNVLNMHDGPKLQNGKPSIKGQKELKLFEKFSELEPDIVFKLKVLPEIAAKRKASHSPDTIRVKCEKLEEISFKSAKVIEIDASKPYPNVLLEIKNEIWKNLP